MSKPTELKAKVDQLNTNFAALGDGPFRHFYCPILHRDDETELCLGHIINQSVPSSSRATIPQRKDVDNFYGTYCESSFAQFLRAHDLGADAHSILSDPELRRRVPWELYLDGRSVKCYEFTGQKHPLHPIFEFRGKNGESFTLAVKTTDELGDAGQFEIVVDRNYSAEAAATLLKSAHLTQFFVLGYEHVFSAAGLMLADILKTFYVHNKDKPRPAVMAAMKEYFSKHTGMILPLLGYKEGLLKGTVEDRRFMACLGSSGEWYGLGVFVRTNDRMHVVLTPTTRNVDTSFDLIGDLHDKTFVYQLIEFVPGNETEPTYWKAGEKQYVFDSRGDR